MDSETTSLFHNSHLCNDYKVLNFGAWILNVGVSNLCYNLTGEPWLSTTMLSPMGTLRNTGRTT